MQEKISDSVSSRYSDPAPVSERNPLNLLILGGVWWALDAERYAVLIPLVLVQAFVMQAYLIAFHEAAHGALCPVGAINGYLGRSAALFSFTSLTLASSTGNTKT